MTSAEKMQRADGLEAEAKRLRAELRAEQAAETAKRPLLERLVFAATTRCPCGAGLAYDPAAEDESSPFRGPSAWDCSAILLGTAVPRGQPGAVTHTGRLPFAFYEVKSENQPSADGRTTRPVA
jgi:hypothetical protein